KHQAGWTYTQARDGSGTLTWTTPTGHTYITEPDTPITATLHPTATTATAQTTARAAAKAAAEAAARAEEAPAAVEAEAAAEAEAQRYLDQNPPF
ncbi:hypothetical protein AB4Y94_00005, partial [Glaciibacter sp. 2TAF33]